MGELTVADVGERDLIDRLVARLAVGSEEGEVYSGDDAAVLNVPGARLLFTTDVLVEGVDFSFDYASGADVGWKVVAANVSDIAAMGGRPSRALATLALPGHTPVALVDDLATGIKDACDQWGVRLVGGDISEAAELSAALSLLGGVGPEGATLRSGAHIGNALCVTGSLGGAAGGLIVLRDGLDDSSEEAASLIARQLRPRPRLEEGTAIARAGAGAMIDLSDGLAVDLGHLVEASGVGCEVDLDAVPVDPALGWLAEATRLDATRTAVVGGEDFELLFTIDDARMGPLAEELAAGGAGCTRIGRIVEGTGRIGGREIDEWRRLGWEHLRGR